MQSLPTNLNVMFCVIPPKIPGFRDDKNVRKIAQSKVSDAKFSRNRFLEYLKICNGATDKILLRLQTEKTRSEIPKCNSSRSLAACIFLNTSMQKSFCGKIAKRNTHIVVPASVQNAHCR